MATGGQALTGQAALALTTDTLPSVVAPPAGKLLPALLLALRKYASVSRCMIVRPPDWLPAGFTHAASVRPVVTVSEADEATRTRSSTPSNETPLPYLPAAHVAASWSVAVFLLPS